MPATPDPGGFVSPAAPSHVPPLAAEAQRRIAALWARADAELRDLTDAERAEYERLRGVYVRAVLAA